MPSALVFGNLSPIADFKYPIIGLAEVLGAL
jgi:hypothetical protein